MNCARSSGFIRHWVRVFDRRRTCRIRRLMDYWPKMPQPGWEASTITRWGASYGVQHNGRLALSSEAHHLSVPKKNAGTPVNPAFATTRPVNGGNQLAAAF